MNLNELRACLSNEGQIENDPFAVLKLISIYVDDSDYEDIGRELVLRALDKWSSFYGYQNILESLTRQVGLFPYLEEENLSLKDSIAYEVHKPSYMDDGFVFHRDQARVYQRLLSGESVILSAPTSFGKSKVIDAIIATNMHDNIAVIVPTIALIDETRKRLSSYKTKYKIITQITQESSERNIFIFTAERIVAYVNLPQINFFVIDEFYKIGAISEDESRTVALNQAFYRLQKNGGQFYMLGPNIQHIPDGLEGRFSCFFYSTKFSTVVSEVVPVRKSGNEIERLITLAQDLDDQTLIFCRSPKRVNEVARALIESAVAGHGYDFDDVADWVSTNYHPEWVYQAALKSGIGIHHGKLPRSLAQLTVSLFNQGRLKFLICTSTLIEGVNTSAKNVIILDDKINRTKYDFFTFNNIRGRGGRMFHHFIGKVYIFNDPPQEDLPFVDFPVYSQGEDSPDSLLIQIDEEDLKPRSIERIGPIFDQNILPLDVIRDNSGIDPDKQIELAKILFDLDKESSSDYLWKAIPNSRQIYSVCNLIWNNLTTGRASSGVYSGKQLAFKIIQLMQNNSVHDRIIGELTTDSRYRAETVDEAVERVLDFDRRWAGFEFPRLLMALSRIQQSVFIRKYGISGDYSFFAARTEALFRNPVAVALEEFGLPTQITDKICMQLPLGEELDVALEQTKIIDENELKLSAFEKELFVSARAYI